MKNTSIVVKENTFAVADIAKSVTNHFEAVTLIKSLENATEVNTKAIALVVKQVKDKEIFKESGHTSITDYVSDIFGYSKAHTSGMLKVVNRFLTDTTATKYANENGDFTFTQLRAMTKFDDKELDELIANGAITFDSTVKEIEELHNKKKAIETTAEETENAEETKEVTSEATSEKYYVLADIIVNGEHKDIGNEVYKFTEGDITKSVETSNEVITTKKAHGVIYEFIYNMTNSITTVNIYKVEG